MFHLKRVALCALVFVVNLTLMFYFCKLNAEDEILLDQKSEYLYRIPYSERNGNVSNTKSENIAIVIVLAEGVDRGNYSTAIDTMECYSRIHGYQFILTRDEHWGCHHLKDKFFRRHCVVAKILPKYGAVLYIDADIGVVNPTRKIQEYLDENIDITFYNRHFSPEIAAGAYLVKNTEYAIQLLRDFSEYEVYLPHGSYHGTDNGAIHMFLAEKLFPANTIELDLCRRAWKNSKNVVDLLTYTSCIRSMYGMVTDFEKVRILAKGTGFVRDGWLTNGMWSLEHDFMLHGWKSSQLAETPTSLILPEPRNPSEWYNPFKGNFDMDRCVSGNTTWNYDERLVAAKEPIEFELRKYEMRSALQRMEFYRGSDGLIRKKHTRGFLQPSVDSLFKF